jgi:putative transposase
VPWCEMSPMEQRQIFVLEARQQWWSMTELCARYGISRKTGYKWLARADDLRDRSRRPHQCPHAIPDAIVRRVLQFRRAHRRWGPKKLSAELAKQDPTVAWPARSTIGLLLRRHGLVRARRRRPAPGVRQERLTPMAQPNAVWTIDYKGWFHTGCGAVCYPLTVQDGFSRYLLACAALHRPEGRRTQQALERVFREYGLPEVIRSDTGSPFASRGLARLSTLAVWLIRLGVRPELIEPAAPQQNGRHERMHRTLKLHTARPPAATWAAQVQRFRRFREDYNQRRPHEALRQAYPAAVYRPSERPYPAALPVPAYPPAWIVREVYGSGEMLWRGHRIWLTTVLAHQPVGLREVADGYWELRYGPLVLGVVDERQHQVRSAALLATLTAGARVLTHARAD